MTILILCKRILQKICMYIDIFPIKCRCEARAVSKKDKPQCTNNFTINSYTELKQKALLCSRHRRPKLLIDSKFRNLKYRLSLVPNKAHDVYEKTNHINKQFKELNENYRINKSMLYTNDFIKFNSLSSKRRDYYLFIKMSQLMAKVDNLTNEMLIIKGSVDEMKDSFDYLDSRHPYYY